MNLTFVAIASFFVTLLGVAALADERSPLYKLDIPGNRSLHREATPRGGGLILRS